MRNNACHDHAGSNYLPYTVSGLDTNMTPLQQLSLGYEQPADLSHHPAPKPGPALNAPTPGEPVRRRDSLSLDISSFHPSQQSDEQLENPVKRDVSWKNLNFKTPWRTFGGTDVAYEEARPSRDVYGEMGAGRRRRSAEI